MPVSLLGVCLYKTQKQAKVWWWSQGGSSSRRGPAGAEVGQEVPVCFITWGLVTSGIHLATVVQAVG